MADTRDVVIAIVNSSEDTVEMLRLWLQQSGFTSIVTGHVQDFKNGDVDFVEFVRRHKPDIFIYDVSIRTTRTGGSCTRSCTPRSCAAARSS